MSFVLKLVFGTIQFNKSYNMRRSVAKVDDMQVDIKAR